MYHIERDPILIAKPLYKHSATHNTCANEKHDGRCSWAQGLSDIDGSWVLDSSNLLETNQAAYACKSMGEYYVSACTPPPKTIKSKQFWRS